LAVGTSVAVEAVALLEGYFGNRHLYRIGLKMESLSEARRRGVVADARRHLLSWGVQTGCPATAL